MSAKLRLICVRLARDSRNKRQGSERLCQVDPSKRSSGGLGGDWTSSSAMSHGFSLEPASAPLSWHQSRRTGSAAVPARGHGRPKPVLRPRTRRERDYWTSQMMPFKSTLPRPLTPKGLLGSAQRMNGPSMSRCPEAEANLLVPFTILPMAL
jgi:hypothetical protein